MNFLALFSLVLFGVDSGTESVVTDSKADSLRGSRSVLYVDDDAPANGNGQSWNTAYRFLTDALTAASLPGSGVTEMHVGQGFYLPDRDELHPNGTGLRTASFQLPGGLSLLGGYAGLGADDPNANDPQSFVTVLSGDLLGNDLPEMGNISDNSFRVVTVSASPLLSRLDGFVIRDANADTPPFTRGGGIAMIDANLEVSHCIVTDNSAYEFGGGLHTNGGQLQVHDSSFIANRSGGGGGGVDANSNNQQITNCMVADNKGIGPQSSGGGLRCSGYNTIVSHVQVLSNEAGEGGGMIVFANATIDHCIFSANQSTYFEDGGGGLRFIAQASPCRIISCGFYGNSALNGHGGGFSAEVFDHQIEVTNCVFSKNSGKAIFVRSTPDTTLPRMPFTNCTFVRHTDFVSIARFEYFSGDFKNCVLWENTLPLFQALAGPPVLISYSVTHLPGAGNSNADPLLADIDGPDDVDGTPDDDVHLLAGSPAIDAGNNLAVPDYVTTDFDGAPRFVNDLDSPDIGIGPPPIVDKGALEFQPVICGDINEDGQVDLADFDAFMLAFGTSKGQPGFNPVADFNGDGVVGLADYGIWYQCYVKFS